MLLAVVISYLSGVFGDKHRLDAETRNALIITANGPAIWGGCVPAFCHKKRDGTCFCHPGTNFIEHYVCRGTSLNGAANLSPVTNFEAGTGAVSRYKLSRSQKFVKV